MTVNEPRKNHPRNTIAGVSWPALPARPEHVREGEGLAILCGVLSAQPGWALCPFDLDTDEAIAVAPRHLPTTGMTDGRESRPRSRWFYLCALDTVPPEYRYATRGKWWDATVRYAKRHGIDHHPGPLSVQAWDWAERVNPATGEPERKRREVAKLCGTGTPIVVAPAVNRKDPSRPEPRYWHSPDGLPGQPAVASWADLLAGLRGLAADVGAEMYDDDHYRAKRQPRGRRTFVVGGVVDGGPPDDRIAADRRDEPAVVRDAVNDLIDLAVKAPCVKGHGDDRLLSDAVLVAVHDYALSPETAARLIVENYVETADTPILPSDPDDCYREVLRRANSATALTGMARPRGWKRPVASKYMFRLDRRTPAPTPEYQREWVAAILAEQPGGGGEGGGDPEWVPRAWNDPARLADEFLDKTIVRFIKGNAFAYGDGHYTSLSADALKAEVYGHVEEAALKEYRRKLAASANGTATEDEDEDATEDEEKPDVAEDAVNPEANGKPKGKPKPKGGKKPKINKVSVKLRNEALAAVQARGLLPDDTTPGTWVGGDRSRPKPITVANGLLDTATRTIASHSPDWFSLARLGAEYVPGAKSDLWLTVLDRLMEGDADRIALLQEVFGACLDPTLTWKHFAVFAGDGDNGKSVVLTVLRALVGNGDYSSVGLAAIASDKFATWGMYGKLANIVGDESHIDSHDESVLKQLTGGDPIRYEARASYALLSPSLGSNSVRKASQCQPASVSVSRS